ncbi:voltage-dependent calcium channel gamma-7 subunit-like [Haliotis rufescens]|uniref:voltage-dependent calcium channel gamma-7 subunit-like n=1 Tax=Haliotis rufescens TaxID=6454 RepID=UPI001EB001AE|nr:voltage-dependent calcium channel gamma-7 subunit-like [Haliotis rufescens]
MKVACSMYVLTCLSFAFGSLAGITLSLAVATDAWLFTKDRISLRIMKPDNTTEDVHVPMELRSGLWRVCTINLANGTSPDQCISIDYNQKGSGRGEGAQTSMSIVGAYRISTPCPVVALILGFTAIIFHVTGTIRRNSKTLVAGVLYIMSGLVLAVGIILFISAINDEVGHRPTKSFSFSYKYGWSFYIAGLSFIASELAAVVCVTIFLRRHSKISDMINIIPGLEEKLDKDYEKTEQKCSGQEDRTMLYMG